MRNVKPQFYGSVTVGERGQVVIPVQARRRYNIKAGDKLLVLGNPFGVTFFTVDSISRLLSEVTDHISSLEKVLSQVSERDSHDASSQDTKHEE